jgi:tRNA dimethylallyltransferase
MPGSRGSLTEEQNKKALVVCGPTASGKSEVSDALADALSREHGAFVPTLVVDSMQVYCVIPTITNQARRRPAELVGIVSVTEEWTVARHRALAEEIIAQNTTPFVLDAGTGMYLNAILLDIPLAPKVEPNTRKLAQSVSGGATNPRRAARARELELAGAAPRRSIWDAEPRYDTSVIYLRPDKDILDASISRRTEEILLGGLEEAATLAEMQSAGARINASVADSIGVRELTDYVSGHISAEQARSLLNTRTRQLARRQMRWFDKLARNLEGCAPISVLEHPNQMNTMHGRIWA